MGKSWSHLRPHSGWKANLQEIGFQIFTVTCVSVSKVSRWHTPKMYKVAFKVRYAYYYEHFLSIFFFRNVPSNHCRYLEWNLSRYIKGLCLRLSNNEFLDPVFQHHRNFIQTPICLEKSCSVEEGHFPVPDLDLEIWRGGGAVIQTL